MFHLRTLGTLDLTASSGAEARAVLAQPKRMALLVYLTLASPRGYHRRDTLLGLLWPELDQEHARGALNRALYYLRQALGEGVVLSRGNDDIGVSPTTLWCDALAFQAALEAGRPEDALELFRGDLLQGFFISGVPDFEQWLEQERAWYRSQAVDGCRTLVEREEAKGNLSLAIHWARRELSLSPYNEAAARRLIGLLNQAGERAEAVHVYEEFARRLATDMEVETAIETRELIASLRSQERPPAQPLPVPSMVGPQAGMPEVQPVRKPPTNPTSAGRAAGLKIMQRIALVLLLILPLAIASWLLGWKGHAGEPLEPKAVAVLPFTNLSSDSAGAYFSAGVAEDIGLQLSKIGALRVISRAVVLDYQRRQKSLREMGEELGLAAALSGSVRRDGDRLRVVVQLVNPHSGEQLWAESYERQAQDVFAIQSDIAVRLAETLQARLSDDERGEIQQAPTPDVEAYAYVLRAEQLLNPPSKNHRDTELALSFLRKALELDPQFARAYNGLGAYYFWRAMTVSDLTMADSAIAYASTALSSRIDRRERQVSYRVMANAYSAKHSYRRALEFNLRALELDSTFYWGHIGVAEHQLVLGESARALPAAQRALALRPDREPAYNLLIAVFFDLDSLSEAERWARKSMELFPDSWWSYTNLAEVYLAQGNVHLAGQSIARAFNREGGRSPSSGDELEALHLAMEVELALGNDEKVSEYYGRHEQRRADVGSSQEHYQHCRTTRSAWGYSLLRVGRREEARRILDALRRLDLEWISRGDDGPCVRYELAALEAALGNTQEAYRWLDEAIRAGWRQHRVAAHDPLFESLHGDSVFNRMLANVQVIVGRARKRLPDSR